MFGQYSLGSSRWTKADQIGFAKDLGYDIASASKAGHNRLLFTASDGRRGFMLHKTVIAEVSADGRFLTLDDGGWATMTTRRAMDEALGALGVETERYYQGVCSNRGAHVFWGHKFERRATFEIATRSVAQTDAETAPYLVRSDVGGDEYAGIVVTYDGHEVKSTGLDHAIRVPPAHVIRGLRQIAKAVSANGRKATPYWFRNRDSIDVGLDVFGFDIGTNGFGRFTFIGCHAFKTADLRAILRRLEEDYPEAAAKSTKAGEWKTKGRARRNPTTRQHDAAMAPFVSA